MMLAVLACALAADAAFGELPNRFHPVAWMGKFIGAAYERRPAGNRRRFLFGVLIVLAGGLASGSAAFAAERLFRILPAFFGGVAGGLLLKQCFSLRFLFSAAGQVEKALAEGKLAEARRLLSYHLVSRDTSELSEDEVAGAAIESLAENLTDGVLSPLSYFLVFGLPGAFIFRFVNTADSMIAYRDPEREYIGKAAAWADTALNFLPARLAALALCAGAFLAGEDGRNAFKTMLKYRSRTASLNAGWTMSAAAGALGVTLEKRGCYALDGGKGRKDQAAVRRARRVAAAAAAVMIAGLFAVAGGVHAVRP